MDNELLHGTLDVMVLKALSWGPMHGYGIGAWIGLHGGDMLQLEEGSLYPALYRLEHKGLVSAEWGLSEKNRRAKYYRLTPQGRAALRSRVKTWTEFSRAVANVLAARVGPARA